MKKFFFVTFLFVIPWVYAQEVYVESTRLLTGTEPGGFYHPTFSPSGDYLLLTGENYRGLTKYDLNKSEISVLTQAANAGYKVQISEDGKNIFYREASLNERNMQYLSLNRINTDNLEVEQIVSPTRDLSFHRVVDGTVLYVKDEKASAKRVSGKSFSDLPAFVTIEDQQMVLYKNRNRNVLSPNGTEVSYIWPSISPDGKKIVYTVAGRGTYVAAIDGSNPISLGRLRAPAWVGNEWIVGMNDKDDGHIITSSTIDIISVDGKNRKTLSDPSLIAMYPSASSDASSIVFNTDRGNIYMMKINIK